jgi:hypothetical protein
MGAKVREPLLSDNRFFSNPPCPMHFRTQKIPQNPRFLRNFSLKDFEPRSRRTTRDISSLCTAVRAGGTLWLDVPLVSLEASAPGGLSFSRPPWRPQRTAMYAAVCYSLFAAEMPPAISTRPLRMKAG